ncbi:tail fiber assembly protein [Yersinia sp. 1252 StPb PI]|uniref:tail fiber assembly protein n=1 Tax=Yersinia sp. 1252 StPb PI TaxID=3117404 RepID=UPI003B28D31B
MSKYAVVLNGLVINIVTWDGVTEWVPNEGEAIPAGPLGGGGGSGVGGGSGCGIGWSYADGTFTAPPEPEPTHDEVVAMAFAKKSSLMQIASEKISILQDAVDLEMAKTEEIAQLKAWKKYRVLLMRIDTSKAPDIEWPLSPE